MSKRSAQALIDKLSDRVPPPQTVSMSVRVNPDTWAELHNVASYLGVSVAKLTREILDAGVTELLEVLAPEMEGAE